MTRHIRFTLNSNIPVTAPDSHPEVLRGLLRSDMAADTATGNTYALADVRLLPPVSPTKIVCVGRNYVDHAKELGNPVPEEPLIFLKPPSSLNAHRAPIVFPALSQSLHYEGELGVVIGRRARNIKASSAMDYVAGYTIVIDVTARDLQKKDGQWTRGKGFDTFCPVGPWWVPATEVDLESLRVQTTVDGKLVQDAPVSDMIFSLPVILEFVSQFMTLEPGDLIATGTPPGVGPLVPGSRIVVEVPGVGALENSVVAES